MTGLAAVVNMGDLVALRGGQCSATAKLTIDEAEVAKKQRTFEPPMIVHLWHPLRLAPTRAPDQAAGSGTSGVP